MGALTPTAEQAHALDLFTTGQNLAIEAGAGTGKTSTLVLLAESDPIRRGQYVAFNRAIVNDAGAKLPANVKANTAHSLAFAAVGKRYADRLKSGRMRGDQLARILDLRQPVIIRYGTQSKVLNPGFLAGHVMRAITIFCQTADPEPTERHIGYIDGIDLPDSEGHRTWKNNDEVRRVLAPALRVAWADLQRTNGALPFKHEHYLKCQPPGTMVLLADGTERPIETIRPGQRVVSWGGARLGRIRKTGSVVSHVGERFYNGSLIDVETDSSQRSSYTEDHICVAMIGDALDGKTIVYLMRSGTSYRVGRTPWRYGSQGNTLGIVSRARSQGADAVWVLSAHDSDREAALAEALAQHEYGLPGWQFRSLNEFMPLDEFWQKVGDNSTEAAECLEAHGRDIRYPLWELGGHRQWVRSPVEIRACNLMDGMRVCDIDRIPTAAGGQLIPGGWTDAWQRVTVRRRYYLGPVHSIEVDGDHTYVADRIVTHNCWQLSKPTLGADFVLFDECQDASPVMLDVIFNQEHAQKILVGDGNQAIYGFTGAVNALGLIKDQGWPVASLTQSFRFGPAVAEVANRVLARLESSLRLRGLPSIPSVVERCANPDAILTRTNAVAMEEVLARQAAGEKPHLVGGGSEVATFAKGAQELQEAGKTWLPDLACFDSWAEVQAYVEHDAQGGELKLLVKLVDNYGAANIREALERMPTERAASTIVSTAHKAKGREWSAVQIAGDFPEPGEEPPSDEELRLLYVAATRAKVRLDITAVALLNPRVPPAAQVLPDLAPSETMDAKALTALYGGR